MPCSVSAVVATVGAQGTTYTDPQRRYRFTVPSGWQPDAAAANGKPAARVRRSSGVFSAPAPLNGNFNVVTVTVPAGGNLDQIVTQSRDNVAKSLPGYQEGPGGIQSLTLGGQPARRYDYFLTPPGASKLHGAQVIAQQGNAVFVLTFTAADTTSTFFQQGAPILSSFKYIGTGGGPFGDCRAPVCRVPCRSTARRTLATPRRRHPDAVAAARRYRPSQRNRIAIRSINGRLRQWQPQCTWKAPICSHDPSQIIFSDSVSGGVFSVAAQDASGIDSLDDAVNAIDAQNVTKDGYQAGPNNRTNTVLAGNPATLLEYLATNSNGLQVESANFITLYQGKVYQLIFVTTPDNEDAFVASAKDVFDSWQFT